MKTSFLTLLLVSLVALFSVQWAQAANEEEYVLQGTGDSVTPTFMPGHEGEFDKIAGFLVSGNILFNGVQVGSYEGEVIVDNPPVNLTAPYQRGMLLATYTFPGLGSVDATSQTLMLHSSTTPDEGDGVFAWMGSLSNGTGGLSDAYGLTSGTATANQFTGATEYTEVIRLRFGY